MEAPLIEVAVVAIDIRDSDEIVPNLDVGVVPACGFRFRV